MPIWEVETLCTEIGVCSNQHKAAPKRHKQVRTCFKRPTPALSCSISSSQSSEGSTETWTWSDGAPNNGCRAVKPGLLEGGVSTDNNTSMYY